MEDETNKEFYKLTFSQREGEVPLPDPMQVGKISKRFRLWVWYYIDYEIRGSGGSTYPISPIGNVFLRYQFDVLNKPHDEIISSDSEDTSLAKNIILQKEYHEVLTLIEHILRDKACSPDLRKNLTSTFDEAPIAYYVDKINGLSTIISRASREAGEATKKALETIREGGMEGAATHLGKAVEHINAQQYADSIADSIHAVEFVAVTVVRKIDPKAKAETLGKALNSLQREKLLKHDMLKVVLDKLYSFANNVPGSRHARPDKDVPKVDEDEAVFMFGACASAAAYLVNKHRELEKQKG